MPPIAKSMIQLLQHSATAGNDLLNDRGLKKDLKQNNELKQQTNMNGTFVEQNITEVYEEPFIRVHVKPLCGGSNC